jgi:arylsulfatase A-like enzyme
VFRAAARWLEENAVHAPFFLWVDSFDPHEPWDPPAAYADAYYPHDGIDYIFPVNEGATPEERERMKALYWGEVTFVDKWLGLLLEKLDELGLRDDTILMITSDHGTQLMDHGRFGKGPRYLHPYNTRILWYVRHPDGPSGVQIDALVQSHDLMPTALRLLGVPYGNVDGEDAWSLVTGERESIRDHVVIGWSGFVTGNAGGRASVRDEEWNYVVSVHEEDASPELYQVREDPEEGRNVHEQYPQVVDRQRWRLEAVVGQPIPAKLNEVCDPAPPPIERFVAARRGIGS